MSWPPALIVSAEFFAAMSTFVMRQITVASTAMRTLSADVASMRFMFDDWILQEMYLRQRSSRSESPERATADVLPGRPPAA